MSNIAFPDGSSPLYNQAAYGEAGAEANKVKSSVPGKSGKNKKVKEPDKGFVSFFEKAVLGKVRELPLSEDSLHELLDDVHSSGDSLSKRPFPPEIAAYKTAVRNFIHYVVENSYDTEESLGVIKTKKQAGGTALPERTRHTIIRIIDTRLEGLAASILRKQASQLDILEKLDEIKGLLIDLLE